MKTNDNSKFSGAAETLAAPGAEIDTLQRLYRQEIERAMTEIDSLLLKLHKRVDVTIAFNAQQNLSVLKSCYQSNALTMPALDVLLQHLLTLVRMFKQKLNQSSTPI